jgi:hypothetical protein
MTQFEIRVPAEAGTRFHPAVFDSQIEKSIRFLLPLNVICEAKIVSFEVSRGGSEVLIQFETDSEELINLIKREAIDREDLFSFDLSSLLGDAVVRGMRTNEPHHPHPADPGDHPCRG